MQAKANDSDLEVSLGLAKVKVKCFRVPDASTRVEPELNPDFPPFEQAYISEISECIANALTAITTTY